MVKKKLWVTILITLTTLAAGAGSVAARGVIVDGRPFHLHVPASYNGSREVPLVLLIHGLTATSTIQEAYMRIKAESDARGFIYAYPDGTREPYFGQFWNGAGCCQLPFTPLVDDVTYLDDIIIYVRNHYRLDERRIFLIGHSNGGFMASRYACERSGLPVPGQPRVAAIATLSGGQYFLAFQCGIGSVAVLHIHGTLDEITPYSFLRVQVPGLPNGEQTVNHWRLRNGYPPPLPGLPLGAIDLISNLPGAETDRMLFPGPVAPVEFWTINGAFHIPNLYQPGEAGRTFGAQVVDWLLAHPRRGL